MERSKELNLRWADVRGSRIRYHEKGEGQALLYLHGYNGMKAWASFQEILSQQFRVIAVEHPGFGESQRPDWVKTMDDLTFFYLDILDALKIDRAHVIGSSLGGWLAADLASRYSHRIDKLILVGAMGLHLLDPTYPDIYMISEEEHRELRYDDPKQTVEEEASFLETARANTMTARLAWNPRFHDPKLKFRLHRLIAPTLLVWGESDGIVPLAYAHRYQQLIPHARLEIVARSGHVPQFEQPESFCSTVTEFLRKTIG